MHEGDNNGELVQHERDSTQDGPMEQLDKKQEKTEGKKVVEVGADELAAFMERLNVLESDNKRLLEAVDKARLARADAKAAAGTALIPEMRLTTLTPGGPIVLSWRMTKNESFVDGHRLIEKQYIEVFFEDGSKEEMPLITFFRNQRKETIGELVSRSKDAQTGEESVTLRLSDGRKLEVGLPFVN